MKKKLWQGGLAMLMALVLVMSFPLAPLAATAEPESTPASDVSAGDAGLTVLDEDAQAQTVTGWQLGDGFVGLYNVALGSTQNPSEAFPAAVTGVLADGTTADFDVVWIPDADFSTGAEATFTYTASAGDAFSGYALGEAVQWPVIQVVVAGFEPDTAAAQGEQSLRENELEPLADEAREPMALNNARFEGDPVVYLNAQMPVTSCNNHIS